MSVEGRFASARAVSGERTPRRGLLWLAAALVVGAPMLAPQAARADSTPPVVAESLPPKAKPTPPSAERIAQQSELPADPPQVVVTARRPVPEPGAVVGDIRPELQLDSSDIQSYGVSTLTELLIELAPQTQSDRGRAQQSPVILLNGYRISSFSEIQDIPTEAILRVDILPEEVSLKYGYTADQRVVNIVLKPQFRAITAELAGGETTQGGDATGEAEGDLFRVDHDTRLNLDLKYDVAGGLTYADRDLTPQSDAPFAFGGNVVSATPGGQIDPALSALVGRPVTIAAISSTAAAGQKLTLSDFASTAGLANITDTAADHSLVPASQSVTANAVYARPILWGINATVNAGLGAIRSTSLQGLPGLSLLVPEGDPFSPFASSVVVDRYVAGHRPIEEAIDGWTAHLGSTLNRDQGDWQLSLTDAYDHADTRTVTGAGFNAAGLQGLLNMDSPGLDPFASPPASLLPNLPDDSARSVTDSGNIQLLAGGPLLSLPAGPLYISAKIGDTVSHEASRTLLAGSMRTALSFSRNDADARVNLDVPLASKTNHVLGALGELSVFVNGAVDDLSDFGTLPTLGFGVNWTPIPGYNLIVSETSDHAAPSVEQLDGPVVETPQTPVFDYKTGQTVEVTQISGGNRQLLADSRRVIKVGLTFKPFPKADLTFIANYIDSRIHNPIETFPSASAAIEAAFPDRFVRNADGELDEEDISPVNFARLDRQELRWGINYSRPVGKQPPPLAFNRRSLARRRDGGPNGPRGTQVDASTGGASGAENSGDQPSQGRGPGRGFRGGGFGGSEAPVGGRFQFAIYHTIIFKDLFLVRPGGPSLDLLNGEAAGGAGGQSQHQIDVQVGYTDKGYGARLSADWRSATVVDGGAAGSTGTLNFSDVATVNLRLWDDFSQQNDLTARYPVLQGVRVTLNVTNLFDQSIHVRDSAGPTPLPYQSAFLDPAGRVVSISLRKMLY